VKPSATLSIRRQKTTHRAGDPSRRKKNLLKGARSSILNRAQIDPVLKRTKARQHLVRVVPIKTLFSNSGVNHAHSATEGVAGLRYCRYAVFACAFASLLDFIGGAQIAHFRNGKRAVLAENPQRDAVSGRPAAGIRFFSQPVPAKPFEPYRRHFHGQP